MINYVNNVYDKCLKPCDAQQFSNIINSPKTENLIALYRQGDDRAKPNLPALTYMGVLDVEKYSKYCHQCKEQGTKMQGSRHADFMRPTGLLMMDFDHHSNPRAIYDALLSCFSSDEIAPASVLALAHITPSGDGLRLVLKREKGKSIEQEQYEWFKRIEKHHVGELSFDDVCKDISRLSFAPMQKEILYFNQSLLFGELPNPEDYPDDKAPLFSGIASCDGVIPSGERDLATSPAKSQREILRVAQNDIKDGTLYDTKGAEQYPTDYNGIEYSVVVERLEEQLGGKPERGARNAFIFTMACNLRYICNDDAQWVASILPTYGEDVQKHRMTIQSAINRPMSREMPETLKRALGVAKMCGSDNGQQTTDNRLSALPPAMPSVLPAPIALLTSRTPHPMKEAVAMAVFPPLGAHLCKTEFMYIDNRPYEATFMTLLMAELSAGKSAVNQPIEYIIADMRARDEINRRREREWKEQCATISNTKDRPERPKNLSVQVLTPDMTNAAFVQRLADADGRFLYTQMDEVDLLDAFKTNGRPGSVSQIIRLAFDRGRYGQERVGTTSVNEQVNVRWNWNASTTVQRGRNYFRRSISDGTLSRLSFATIMRDENDWGRTIPRFGTYGEPFAEELRPYIDALNTCHGTLHCPEAEAWAERALDEHLTRAEMSDDRAYAQMSRRAVLMGFLRGMVLYIMNGMQWSQEIDEFAAWSVRYDMWCKVHFFGDLMHQEMEAETMAVTGNTRNNLLDLLPSEFTRQMAQDMRIAQGRKPNPRNMLAQWTHRGYIIKDDTRDVYMKCA